MTQCSNVFQHGQNHKVRGDMEKVANLSVRVYHYGSCAQKLYEIANKEHVHNKYLMTECVEC